MDDPSTLTEFEAFARSIGFNVGQPMEYEHTLVVPVPASLENAEEQFHRSIFKNARKLERAGHIVRPIDDMVYARRMAALYMETMNRTGARQSAPDMTSVIRATAAQAHRYRLTGLFRLGAVDPESLLAFRWCGHAGRYAYDLLAASTRLVEEAGQIPMMPAIMLNVFEWARAVGATHFDFGGVVADEDQRVKAVGGITRFKKQFGGQEFRVGCDLMLEPRVGWHLLDSVQARLIRTVQK
ncbi:MAG: GNAT family N-acetyltransferase [Gemmatimonadaceae bacterium]|nr:GNAT family N-acetyltransferase [Gemmatimonadaceae bacterium]